MISIERVTIEFPGVKALDNVSFDIQDSEVHGLVGENGAGKSTLIKILSGIYRNYSGKIKINGIKKTFDSVIDSQNSGIATIFQELTVIKDLSIAENIFLGREPVKSFGRIDWKNMYERSKVLLESLGVKLNPREKVSNLSIANQQVVEICKALVLNAKMLIMDEPTSSLTEHEVDQLFKLIKNLKKRNITVLYVSHKIEEIFEICDRITVLRDGKHIGTVKKQEVKADEIIKMMVGRSIDMIFPTRKIKKGSLLLSVKGITRKNEFYDVSFELHSGEIIGFAGLIGAGRTEIARTIIGATQPDDGEILLKGKVIKGFTHPYQSLTNGIAYLSEDRKGEGLMLELSVRENMTISILKSVSKYGIIQKKYENSLVQDYINKFRIKVTDHEQMIESLSGGNQQKVVISKLLLTKAEIFIFDEPTRGIDIGAKSEIYKIMNDLTKEGKGIIFISSELPEIIGISDEIMCMREGRLVKKFKKEEVTQEKIMRVLTGGIVNEE